MSACASSIKLFRIRRLNAQCGIAKLNSYLSGTLGTMSVTKFLLWMNFKLNRKIIHFSGTHKYFGRRMVHVGGKMAEQFVNSKGKKLLTNLVNNLTKLGRSNS